MDLLQYLERSEERFLEQSSRDQDLATAMLHNIQRIDIKKSKHLSWTDGTHGVGAGGAVTKMNSR